MTQFAGDLDDVIAFPNFMSRAQQLNVFRSIESLPPEIHDRSDWYGAELAGRGDWVERLSEAEIAEVEKVVGGLKRSEVDLTKITGKDAPLPTLAPRLQDILDEVLNGRGFVLIKGLPVERWTRREAAIAFLAIGVQLGNLRMQNAEGHLLGHVRDLGRSSDDPNTRIYQTRERQTHHTDSCDVVGLMCLQTAKVGWTVEPCIVNDDLQRDATAQAGSTQSVTGTDRNRSAW